MASLGEITETTLVTLLENPSAQKSGKEIFQTRCSSCHGMFGEGGIGPNLTDDYWLHGAQLMDIYRTVKVGVPEKGMLPWERQLKPAELLSVSAYVGSLLGSDPPQGKEPQGDPVKRAPADSVVPGQA